MGKKEENETLDINTKERKDFQQNKHNEREK